MACPTLSIEQAGPLLRSGEVLAYPTEAVYGLGCDPFNDDAVRRLLEIKARPESAGLILIADNFSRFDGLVETVDEARMQQVHASWPGPVTWLFPKTDLLPNWISGEHETVALRVSAHPVCRELCAAFGGPLVSTSANLRGHEPARSAQEVDAAMGVLIAGIVDGQLGVQERPSEIRDALTGEVLRHG